MRAQGAEIALRGPCKLQGRSPGGDPARAGGGLWAATPKRCPPKDFPHPLHSHGNHCKFFCLQYIPHMGVDVSSVSNISNSTGAYQ